MLQWEKTERTACGRGEPHAGEKRNHLGPDGGAAGGRHFVLYPGDALAASAETHAASLTALEEKQSTVLELAAASTAASAAITLLPGDAATPIAEKLADISGYFLLALCAIYLEKYLLTVTAYAAFRLLVPRPACCWRPGSWRGGTGSGRPGGSSWSSALPSSW